MDKTCTCVRCDTCKGFGSIHDPFDYGPRSGIDEECIDCDGSGITEMCDYCHEVDEEEFHRSDHSDS